MKITTINEAAMKNLQPGDIVEFRCGGSAEVESYQYRTGANYPIRLSFKGEVDWLSFRLGGELGSSPALFDIIAIIKAKSFIPDGAYRIIQPKASGGVWCVVTQVSLYGSIVVVTQATKHEAIEYAKLTSHRVLAIFNPFITGGKWKEGQGLELLEE